MTTTPDRYQCPRCASRVQTWKGDEPQCAFNEAGEFLPDNWMCATMNALRDISSPTYSEDSNAAIIPCEGTFIILGWYKQRGKTQVAQVVDDERCEPLTLEKAESVLNYYEVPA